MNVNKTIQDVVNILLIIYITIIFTLYFSDVITHDTLKNLILPYWIIRCILYELSFHMMTRKMKERRMRRDYATKSAYCDTQTHTA